MIKIKLKEGADDVTPIAKINPKQKMRSVEVPNKQTVNEPANVVKDPIQRKIQNTIQDIGLFFVAVEASRKMLPPAVSDSLIKASDAFNEIQDIESTGDPEQVHADLDKFDKEKWQDPKLISMQILEEKEGLDSQFMKVRGDVNLQKVKTLLPHVLDASKKLQAAYKPDGTPEVKNALAQLVSNLQTANDAMGSQPVKESIKLVVKESYYATLEDGTPVCEACLHETIDSLAEGAIEEAKYHGKTVPLGKPMRGDVKKFKVFVKDPKTGNVKKVNFGDKKMRIKKSNPKRRKSFRARHNCATAKDRTSARYWSCRAW